MGWGRRLLNLNATQMTLAYEFNGSTNIAKATATVTVDISGTRRNTDVVRHSFVCPNADDPLTRSFFVVGR